MSLVPPNIFLSVKKTAIHQTMSFPSNQITWKPWLKLKEQRTPSTGTQLVISCLCDWQAQGPSSRGTGSLWLFPVLIKRHPSLHQTAYYVEIWIQWGSLPARKDIAGVSLPLSLCLVAFRFLLAPFPTTSLSLCRAVHISPSKIKLRQRKETYLALMMGTVSFFCVKSIAV